MSEGYDELVPLTTGQIAQYCHVTHRAVLKWVATGKLKAYRTPGNHSRVKVEDFIQFLRQYNMPLPAQFLPVITKKKILIVDDDRGIVHCIQRLLMINNDYEMAVAYDGFEAGRQFAAFNPEVVILDIRMPGLDGYEVCSKIRSDPKNAHVKILAISGLNQPQEIQKILELGANDYLGKPFSNEDLQKKVQDLLRPDIWKK